MELIHILPKGNLVSKPYQKYELYLADEILRDPEFYRTHVRGTSGYKILDNSLNELWTAVSMEKLEEAASIIEPDEFVYPDSINPEESDELFWKCSESISKYRNLMRLKKMVVIHDYSAAGAAVKSMDYLESGVDVLAYAKVTSADWGSLFHKYDGRVKVVSDLVRRGAAEKVEFHFLGFSGFSEFEGFKWTTQYIRSMDSRVFLETEDLWRHRESILSHVSLGDDRVIENIESRIIETRERYESYGLR